MQILRFFIIVFVYTLLFSPAVKANEAKIRVDSHKFLKQHQLETEKLLETLDLSDDSHSFQIRDIKTGFPRSKIKELYPNSNGSTLINTPTERFSATGNPINSIYLELTTRAIGENCKEQIDQTGDKLIKKYGTPKDNSRNNKATNHEGYWSMTWVPKSQEKTPFYEQSKMDASMSCTHGSFRFTLNANDNHVTKQTKLVHAKREEIRDKGFKRIRLENTPKQDMNF